MIDLAAAPTGAEAHPGKPFPTSRPTSRTSRRTSPAWNRSSTSTSAELKVASSASSTRKRRRSSSPGNFGTIEITDGVAAATKFATRRPARQVRTSSSSSPTRAWTRVSPAGGQARRTSPRRCRRPRRRRDRRPHEHPVLGNGPERRPVPREPSYGNTYAKTLITATPRKDGICRPKSVTFVTPIGRRRFRRGNATCGTADLLRPGDRRHARAVSDRRSPRRWTARSGRRRSRSIAGTTSSAAGDADRRPRRGRHAALVRGGDRLLHRWQHPQQFPTCGYQPVDHTLRRSNYDNLRRRTRST